MVNQRNTANQGNRTVGKMQHFGERATTKQLTEGQLIKGEVTDLRNSQVSILLEDNTKVIGRLDNVNWLSIGDVGTFRVASIEAGSIKLQAIPLSDSEMENNTMFKALEEAGLPHNSRNQSVVLSLIRNQLPITKSSILNVLRQSYDLKDASISTIVLLNKYNIPATHENASQLENYISGNNQLGQELSQCIDDIPSLLREIALFADDEIGTVAKEFFELLDFNPTHQGSTHTENVLTSTDDTMYHFSSNRMKHDVLSILSDFDLPEDIQKALAENKLTLPQLNQIVQECMEHAKAMDQRNQNEVLTSLSPEELVNPMKVQEALADIPKIIDAFDHPEFQRIQEAFQEHLKDNHVIGGFFDEAARNQLAEFVEQNPSQNALAQAIRSGTATMTELMNGIQNSVAFAKPEALQQLFSSNEFMFLISDELKKQWNLSPKDAKSKDNIGAFYQKIYTQTKGLQNMMQRISPDFQESASGTNLATVRNNIDFMQMLNQIFPYVQIPFDAKGFSGNGELYVYTKKEDIKRNPHQISVLLHLSLEHLGEIAIHVTKNGLVLENKFFVEDEQAKRLLKKNINLLSDKLQELGYMVTNDFAKKEGKPDLVNDFIAQKKEPTTAIKRYTFDIRA